MNDIYSRIHTMKRVAVDPKEILKITRTSNAYKHQLLVQEQENLKMGYELEQLRIENRRLTQETKDLLKHIEELQIKNTQLSDQLDNKIESASTDTPEVKHPTINETEQKAEMKYELTCGICHEIPIAPFSTNCGHIFCHDCMMGCIRHKYSRCPTCRAPRVIPTADEFCRSY